MGRDPIQEKGGLHLYAFALNDGINKWDKNGCLPVFVAGLIGGGLDLGVQLYRNGGNLNQVSWSSVGVSAVASATGFGLFSVGSKLFASTKAVQVAMNPAVTTIWSVNGGSLTGVTATTAVRQALVDKAVSDAAAAVAGAAAFQVAKAVVKELEGGPDNGQPPASPAPVPTTPQSPTDSPRITVPGLSSSGGYSGSGVFFSSAFGGSGSSATTGNAGPVVMMDPFVVSASRATGPQSGGSGTGSGSGSSSAISIGGGVTITDPDEIAAILGSLAGDPGAWAMEWKKKLEEENQL